MKLQICDFISLFFYSYPLIQDNMLILWLHNLLLDKLRGQLLTSYLEVLQKLKAKVTAV